MPARNLFGQPSRELAVARVESVVPEEWLEMSLPVDGIDPFGAGGHSGEESCLGEVCERPRNDVGLFFNVRWRFTGDFRDLPLPVENAARSVIGKAANSACQTGVLVAGFSRVDDRGDTQNCPAVRCRQAP